VRESRGRAYEIEEAGLAGARVEIGGFQSPGLGCK